MNAWRWIIVVVLAIIVVVGAVALFSMPGKPEAFSANLSNATYTFMGDTFGLKNGSTTIQGHSGLVGASEDTLVPMGYTLAASSTGDINGDGSPDGLAVLYRGFGANLEWVTLFGFESQNGALVQIASSTIYMYDSKVESVSVGQGGVVSVHLLAVSAADRQNLAHYEQVPNEPTTLQFVVSGNSFAPAPGATSTASAMYGMSEYADPAYGFSFWYPSALGVSATTTNDAASFPGGTVLETLNVGTRGGASVIVVDSAASAITDEPSPHASPINQTKYFYDTSSGAWMVAYPEGTDTGDGGATTTADMSKKTIGDLPMLPSGRRFDTTIIPLSTTRFLIVTDGGGSSFTPELAATVAPANMTPNSATLAATLQAEAEAYEQ